MLLRLQVLEDGFDDDVSARNAVASDIGYEAVESIAHTTRILEPVGEELRRSLHGRLQPLVILVLQRDAQAAKRTPRGDVATHGSSANDVHVGRVAPFSATEGFQSLLKLE